MKALTIRQPWAWMILHAGKDVENRTWPTAYRGPLLIHAASGCTQEEYFDGADYAREVLREQPQYTGLVLPGRSVLERGGIVGVADLVGCAWGLRSPWSAPGQYQWVLRDARPVPFVPCRGQLGLWDAVAPTAARRCRRCGCTDGDCQQCVERTGSPCHWVSEDLCSACADEAGPAAALPAAALPAAGREVQP